MKDMMAVLIQYALLLIAHRSLIENAHRLKDVSDPTKVAPDGQTIKGRMQNLCVDVAEDIRRCANTCDTYLKLVFIWFNTSPLLIVGFRKKILVKIFSGFIWEGRLLEFVEIFANRRKDFESALTIHIAVGVDNANTKLNAVDERTAELNQKCVSWTPVVWSMTDNSDQDESDDGNVPEIRHS
jgi:hypothetical protein